ncbi:hypothetical protein PtA15_13A46 [Puccinia triticina]|uniref:Uncharacterized protein n=1 Tax=Puccinia triticina TaxID=208348 RepID=A0ABY7D305_9BASI|nr:uncharacterized protein PtA15_13A46 [Puccinia triticina]WAQ90647.1 hypothetical protein PtA15_13A46 [Puccinia triticina]
MIHVHTDNFSRFILDPEGIPKIPNNDTFVRPKGSTSFKPGRSTDEPLDSIREEWANHLCEDFEQHYTGRFNKSTLELSAKFLFPLSRARAFVLGYENNQPEEVLDRLIGGGLYEGHIRFLQDSSASFRAGESFMAHRLEEQDSLIAKHRSACMKQLSAVLRKQMTRITKSETAQKKMEAAQKKREADEKKKIEADKKKLELARKKLEAARKKSEADQKKLEATKRKSESARMNPEAQQTQTPEENLKAAKKRKTNNKNVKSSRSQGNHQQISRTSQLSNDGLISVIIIQVM